MQQNKIELVTKLVLDELRAFNLQGCDNKSPCEIPVGVSGRHVHLSAQHTEMLFGKGHTLTKMKELMGGQYACEETVIIASQNMSTIEKVRVLGPVRKETQVEISATDAVKLKAKVPARDSGDTKGSAPVTLIGPKGAVVLSEGMIIAARHIHFSKNDAQNFGVKDGEMVSVFCGGARSVTFNNVKVRVDESFTLEMHIDTDEANATGIKTGDKVALSR